MREAGGPDRVGQEVRTAWGRGSGPRETDVLEYLRSSLDGQEKQKGKVT